MLNILKKTLFLILFAFLTYQTPPIRDASTQPTTEEKKDIIKIEDYFPVSIEDPRIDVNGISLDRRYSPDGRGEILDVFFNIDNNTNQKIDLFVWVVAYYETNAIDTEERKIIPHPKWRVSDPDQKTFINRYIKITPQDIPQEKIWNQEDPDYKKYYGVVQRMRNTLGNLKIVGDIYPPVWKYINYIMRYPTQGVPVILYGDQGPTLDKLLSTNYIPPTPEEKKTKLYKNIPNHTYTIEYSRRRTIFRSHHYTAYRSNFAFYNMFRILIFDANKAKQFEEQKNTNSTESLIDPLMYHRIFYISQNVKIK
ncbi:MAG: hypothetical protein ACK4UJ_03135 [Leptonema sp. (in: bacteria)]